MIFSIFAGKVLTKFNNTCENKSPEGGHKGNLPQNNKGHVWKSHSKHHSQWWQAVIIPSKLFRKKKNPSMSTLTTIIQQSFGSLSQGNKRRKRKKRNPNQKRRTKTVTVYRWCDTILRKS